MISPFGPTSYFSVWYNSRPLASCSIDRAVWPRVLLLNWLLVRHLRLNFLMDKLLGNIAWYWCSHLVWKAWKVVAPPGSQRCHPPSQLSFAQAWIVVAPHCRSRHRRHLTYEHTVWTHAALTSTSGSATYFSAGYRSCRLTSCSIDHAVWPCILRLNWLLSSPSGFVAALTPPSGHVSYSPVGYRSYRLASCNIVHAVWPCFALLR